MYSKELLLLACLFLLGGLRLTSTTTTTTFVAAMSIANQDLERYFRSTNASTGLVEERIILDVFNYAFLNYTYELNGQLQEVNFDVEKARYGEGKVMSVKGKLVHMSDAEDQSDDTACSANLLGTNGEHTPATGISWIALVRRGRCTFEEKVKNVHAKGAIGVIVYNDKEVSSLEKMQIKNKNRDITAVITYQQIGVEMALILDQGIDINMAIIEGRFGSRPINTLNRTSVLFVSISFIVLMVISLVWLIFYYIQRFRYLQTKDQQSRQLCSVTKKAIMKIPTKTGKSSDEKDVDSDCCAICIEAYKPSDCIRVLPCNHEFHKSCIDPWLIEHRTCPMCKLDVLKFYGFVFLGSEESILEYQPSRRTSTAVNAASSTLAPPAASNLMPNGGGGALADLIRSREFVLEFPRIFVLDANAAVAGGVMQDSIFPQRLPERSQSSMSLAHAKDWMSAVTNKLDEQHGLRRLRKSNVRDDMEENLLRVDSVRKQRSRSADGRYSHGFFGRQELLRLQALQKTANAGDYDCEAAIGAIPKSDDRRSVATLRNLTDAPYAQSRPRQLELRNAARRRSSMRRNSDIDIPLRELPYMARAGAPPVVSAGHEYSSPHDVAITIQLNGEGIDVE